MIDAYAITTTLKLNDLVSAQLSRLTENFVKLDKSIFGVQKNLKAIGNHLSAIKGLDLATEKLAGGMKSVSTQALNAARNFDRLGNAKSNLRGNLGIAAELTSANHQAGLLAGQLAGMRHAGIGGGGGTPLLPSGGSFGAGGGGRRGHLHGGNLHVGPSGFGIGGVGMGLASDMLVPLAAAGVAAYVGSKFYESARDFQDEVNRFKALNLGDAVNDEAVKFAKSTNAFGVSRTEMMKAMSESVGLFGSFGEATKFTPMLVELGKANDAIFGDKHGAMDDEGLKSVLKFIDRRGGFKDEDSFKRALNLAERMVTGSGGFLKFGDLGQFSQQAGTAFRGLSDEGLLHMENLLSEQGGSRAGTALMSLYQNLVAGRTPKKTMGMLQDLGLAHLEEQTHGSVGGKPLKSIVMKDLKDSDLLQADPAKWVTEDLLPALAAKGITSQQDILRAVNDVISNRSASSAGSIMSTQELQMLRDQKMATNAMSADGVIDLYKHSASGAEADFDAAWKDFKTEFGNTMLPAITDMLKTGTAILRAINGSTPEQKVAARGDPGTPVFGGPSADAAASSKRPPGVASKDGSSWGIFDRFMPSWVPGASPSPHAEASVNSVPKTGMVSTTINMDGKPVAHAISPYLADSLGLPSSTGTIDYLAMLPMPGINK